ncbi:DUF4105 domain-containing protein [Adhaeribacter aquaticus]|uniref:Lnb N-terminal periplasmic domain-containing protein n=1 Tax=Adhaeribacter aquaticus TaxID=299567 RepID=UPI0006844549|nr:DUF4105 domain-containing protein [Adhaeribacter aquaticus]
MNKRSIFKLIILCLGFLLVIQQSKAFPLSPQAKISLITVSPGAELYSMYGHSAIRVVDPVQDMDVVFNYGTFDFNTPNFYIKFIQGKLPYNLSAGYFQQLLENSQEDNRSVYEQVLNLNLQEKQWVMDFLENNYLPENRSYLYDFFYDNCATRIRDVFKKGLGNKLIYPQTPLDGPPTFRQLVGIYQAPHPWVDLGIDLLMGLPADKVASPTQMMFLPDFLMQGFDKSRVGGMAPFVQSKQQLFKATAPPAEAPLLTPSFIFWVLLVVVVLVTILQIRQKAVSHALDIVLFSLTGLLGIILTFLWFGTDHQSFSQNLNILWAFPLHLPVAFLLLKEKKSTFIKTYFLVTAAILVLLAVSWKILPQEFHPSVLPLVLTLAIRGWYIAKGSKKVKSSTNPYK